jgi:hydrophobic/amphiphilic exporter-1 (mainly G- bacteria), HAE1 family
MTSFAFLLGVLPLAISSGAGGNAHQTMGTAVMGGTAAASVIAIFLIPVTFYVVGKMAGDRKRKGPAKGPEPAREKEEDHV